jgi:hypothetical protein
MSKRFQPPETCPVCGEDVPRKARACPECGADEESGWKEGALQSDGLPDEEFDYDRFVANEFGSAPRKDGMQRVWWLVSLILLAILVGGLLMPLLRR